MQMGRDLEDILRTAGEGASDRWHQARAKAVADAENAYQRGRQAYADAIQLGSDVVARISSEVARAGRAANAAIRVAANAASLGMADRMGAGTEALFGMGGSGNLQQRFDHQLTLQHQAKADARR